MQTWCKSDKSRKITAIWIGAKETCRSRQELSDEYLLAKFGFDTAENEPPKGSKKCMLERTPLMIRARGCPQSAFGCLRCRSLTSPDTTSVFAVFISFLILEGWGSVGFRDSSVGRGLWVLGPEIGRFLENQRRGTSASSRT